MINGDLEIFLDTGWFSEALLFLNGRAYWHEAQYDPETGQSHFFVYTWRAINEDNKYCHAILNRDGTFDWSYAYEDYDSDSNLIKERFLQAKIYDGKTFWEVESEIAWLDDEDPVYEQDVSE